MGNEQEHIQGLEGHGLDREEVSGPDVRCMIAEEGAPGLGRRPPQGGAAVAADRFGTDLEAELGELAADAHASPARVLPRQPPDQLPHLSRDRRPSRTPMLSAPPGPVLSPGFALPPDYGVRLHDDQGPPPIRPEAREPGPEQTVSRPQPRPARLAGEDGELLAKGDVLKHETLPRTQGAAQEGAEEEEICDQGRTSLRAECLKAGPLTSQGQPSLDTDEILGSHR